MKRTAITQSDVVRLRYLSQKIYQLGPRPVHELLLELATGSSGVINVAETYAAIDEAILDRFGGRFLPPVARRVK